MMKARTNQLFLFFSFLFCTQITFASETKNQNDERICKLQLGRGESVQLGGYNIDFKENGKILIDQRELRPYEEYKKNQENRIHALKEQGICPDEEDALEPFSTDENLVKLAFEEWAQNEDDACHGFVLKIYESEKKRIIVGVQHFAKDCLNYTRDENILNFGDIFL